MGCLCDIHIMGSHRLEIWLGGIAHYGNNLVQLRLLVFFIACTLVKVEDIPVRILWSANLFSLCQPCWFCCISENCACANCEKVADCPCNTHLILPCWFSSMTSSVAWFIGDLYRLSFLHPTFSNIFRLKQWSILGRSDDMGYNINSICDHNRQAPTLHC